MAAAPVQADPPAPDTTTENTTGSDANTVANGLTDIETSTTEAENLFEKQKQQITDLQKQLEERKVLQDQSDEQRKELADSMNAQVEALNTLIRNWKEYQGNVHALQAEANAKKYLPWAYAVLALALYKKDAAQDKALVGLAGYGTGAQIEQSNWGLAHFGTRALFKMGYKF